MRSLLKNVTLWSLTLGHFGVDMLAGSLPIVVGLYLKDSLQLDLAQIGLTLGLFQMTSSLTQPIFGYFSDLYGGRWFSIGGVLWMALLIGSIGFMPTFGSVLVLMTLAGLGSAAFHPQGASGANKAAGENKAAGVAMFMIGGNLGFAVGPILAAAVLSGMGMHGSAVLGLVGLLTVPLLYFLTRPTPTSPKAGKAASWKIELNPSFTTNAVIALILVMSLRALSQQSFSSFMPQFFTQVAHFSKTEASMVSSIMLFVLAFGSLSGGVLADRVGGIKVMVISMLLSAPLMAAMILFPDWRAFWIAPAIGFLTGAAWPPMLVMAQSLFPKNAGVGSGVALGFVFAIGGIGLQITGWLAEPHRLGLSMAMLLLSAGPILTAVCASFLASAQKQTQVKPIEQRLEGVRV